MAKVKLTKTIKKYGNIEVIHGIDLDIKDGEFCVFVGPSGCGKSTLLRMISGLENTTSGNIYIGKDDVTNIDASERGVAMVFQSYALYPHMSVRENMGFGLKMNKTPKKEIDEKVKKASDILKLEPYLDRRPKSLSGGQRQRISIARALLAKPKIVILDEATSNLDTQSEAFIQKSLSLLMRDRTTFVIAHRLSTIQKADQILVIENGDIVERGKHKELLASKGRYYELYTYQTRI